jgi:uncharacterized protein (TIGR02147 family)
VNAYDAYSYRDYKLAIKERVAFLKNEKKTFTLKLLAKKIPLQYTYLSMLLNKHEQHLSESQLYRAGELLGLVIDEIDFLMLLRSMAVAQDSKFRNHLSKRIEQLVGQRALRANHDFIKKQNADVEYLMNPINVVVGQALDIQEFQKAPHKLCAALGISPGQLKVILETLERLGILEIDEDTGKIMFKGSEHRHIGQDHPLMRTHQVLVKNNLIQRLSQTHESNKESFFVTFTMDDSGYLKIKNLFKSFIKEVQNVAMKSKNEHVFQMNFDLLKWI